MPRRAATVADVSPGGVGLRLDGVRPEALVPGTGAALGVDMPEGAHDVPIDLRSVRAVDGGVFAHAAFRPRDEVDAAAITHLNYADSAPLAAMLQTRQRRQGALKGTLVFIWTALRALATAIRFTARSVRSRRRQETALYVEVADGYGVEERAS